MSEDNGWEPTTVELATIKREINRGGAFVEIRLRTKKTFFGQSVIFPWDIRESGSLEKALKEALVRIVDGIGLDDET